MVSLKQRQSGFTIVELLIVIVIIGILATLVIVTFSGVQQRARDSERKTDINALAGQLEAAYANVGYYPGLDDFNTAATRTALEIKLDTKALADPKNKASETLVAGEATQAGFATADWRYHYDATGCTAAPTGAPTDEQCTGYKLSTYLEGNDPTHVYSRQSNN